MTEPEVPQFDPKEVRKGKIVLSVFGVLVFLGLAWLAPTFTSRILFTFSTVAIVWAVIGFIKPQWARIPDRLASIWILALGIGLFIGGGVIQSPGLEDEIATSNGASTAMEDAAREQRRAATRRASDRPASPARQMPTSERMDEASAQAEIQTCYAFVRESLAGTGSTARFRPFWDGAGMQHLGDGRLFLRSFAYITRADGSVVEMHYDCTAEDGAVMDFTIR